MKGGKAMTRARVKMARYFERIETIKEALGEVVDDLEQRRDDIEERAISYDREMTNSEQERYDELDEQIASIYDCMDTLDSAMDYISDYC
jgi:chromosome segregation ATPase